MRAARTLRLAALALGLGAVPAAHAQLFKCVQGGKTIYQDAPCAETARQSTLRPPPPAPAAPTPPPEAGAAAAPPGAAPAADAEIAIIAGFVLCSERVPTFSTRYTEAFEGWKSRNAPAVISLASEPNASRLDQRLREERGRPATESMAERCAEVAASLQPPRETGARRAGQ